MQIQQKKLVRQYYLHSQALQEVDLTENLSVMLTSDATWEAHINAVTNKASKTLAMLTQTLKISTKLAKEQADKSFVRLLFLYTCSM